jgi:hypothetical protein
MCPTLCITKLKHKVVRSYVNSLSAFVKTILASWGDSRISQGTEQPGDHQPDKLIKPLTQVRPWFSTQTHRQTDRPTNRPTFRSAAKHASQIQANRLAHCSSFHKRRKQNEWATWLILERQSLASLLNGADTVSLNHEWTINLTQKFGSAVTTTLEA